MPTPTNADRYNGYLRLARAAKRRLQSAQAQAQTHRNRVDELEAMALGVIAQSVGFEEEDVVIDDMGNLYRVTDIQLPHLTITQTAKWTGFQKTLGRVRVKGLLLNKSGIPVWQKDRTVHGKLKKYQPEAS